jgi:hypothetical protein
MRDYLTPLKMISLCTMYSVIGYNVFLSAMFKTNVRKKGIKKLVYLFIYALSLNMNRSITGHYHKIK